MDRTKIDWCDSTWNPVTGCLHGCEYCYARGIAKRFGGWNDSDGDIHHDEILKNESDVRELYEPLKVFRDGQTIFSGKWQKAPYPYDFIPTFHRYRLNDYISKKGRNIFVCSMADLFGSWVPDSWIEEVFKACEKAPQHNYLFLTKYPRRYIELERERRLPWADNFWFGCSVTKLTDTYTWFEKKKFHWFLSVEPILENLGAMNVDAAKPEWVIVGAETGNRKGRVVPDRSWIENLVRECRKYGIPIFMKSSLEDIWKEPLIQEFPAQLQKGGNEA